MKWTSVYMVIGLLIYTGHSADAYDPCRDTIHHKPRVGVVHNPSPSPFAKAQKVKIPVSVDLTHRYDHVDLPKGLELNTQFSHVEIDEDSHIFYNDEDITSDIKDSCDHGASEFEELITNQSENSDYSDPLGKLP